MNLNTIVQSDALEFAKTLPAESVNCVVTSPPYFGLRDYGVAGQIGLEETPAAYIAKLSELFTEIKRVLRSDGVAWVNLGDSYAYDNKWGGVASGYQQYLNENSALGHVRNRRYTGVPGKSLLGIPWRFAFSLMDVGWILRSDVIWHKPNAMPESVADRPTKVHEYCFMFVKSQNYWYDADAVREPQTGNTHSRGEGSSPKTDTTNRKYNRSNRGFNSAMTKYIVVPGGRNRRSVWTVASEPNALAHFATFPQALIEPMILSSCPPVGIVYDPFMGSGTTGFVARRLGRNFIGSELSAEYIAIANKRLQQADPMADQEVAPGLTQRSLFS